MANLYEPDKGRLTPEKRLVSQVARLPYGEDTSQFGELHLPNRPGPHPVAIVIHGGFWRAAYGYTLMTGLAEDHSVLINTFSTAWAKTVQAIQELLHSR